MDEYGYWLMVAPDSEFAPPGWWVTPWVSPLLRPDSGISAQACPFPTRAAARAFALRYLGADTEAK